MIINRIKHIYERRKFLSAAKTELSNLQFQLSVTGLQLAKKFGKLDHDYLCETKEMLATYKGGDSAQSIILFIDTMLNASKLEFDVLVKNLRAEDGAALSLKSHSTVLLDSNAAQISQLPIELQSKIYEFKNVLNIYNQEVAMAKENLMRTYDATLSDMNYQRVKSALENTYADLQSVCTRACRKIQVVLDFEL